MKQGFRFFLRPWTFFNQLQWSTHHWFILLGFLVIAAVETQVGKHHRLYITLAGLLQHRFGIGLDFALWMVTAVKLFCLLAGAYFVSHLVWLVGNMVGTKNSKRVLFRRLAVVFTVLLAGYTAQYFAPTFPIASFVSVVLFIWGLGLGYFAIREQFGLSNLETLVVGFFALLLISSSWHYSNHFMASVASSEIQSLTKLPK